MNTSYQKRFLKLECYSRLNGADFNESFIFSDQRSAAAFCRLRIRDIFARQGDIYCIRIEYQDGDGKALLVSFIDRVEGEY